MPYAVYRLDRDPTDLDPVHGPTQRRLVGIYPRDDHPDQVVIALQAWFDTRYYAGFSRWDCERINEDRAEVLRDSLRRQAERRREMVPTPA